MATKKPNKRLQQLGADLITIVSDFVELAAQSDNITDLQENIIKLQDAQITRLRKEKDALLACRRYEQRCHDCPAYDCVDNTNPDKPSDFKVKHK